MTFSISEMEERVRQRYTRGARRREEALCCPVAYDPRYLKAIPSEILEKDYGCGDPSVYLEEGDSVLDLGSGAGKICYIAAQVVGRKGRVVGVDFNSEMLDLANKYKAEFARRTGLRNVAFRKGKIQNLRGVVPSGAVDIIVSNCVLNLVCPEDKKALFAEMFRVLKKGGRVAISDIVSDEPIPERMRRDPELWSGCISGAFREKDFLKAFEDAGFYGIQIDKRDERPWKTVEGIEFRSMTVTARKGKEGPCFERYQAVVYKGPWSEIRDDDGHVYKRGVRTAVCDKTFRILSRPPYANAFIFISPKKNIPLSKAGLFNCSRNPERHPRETKGGRQAAVVSSGPVCSPGSCC